MLGKRKYFRVKGGSKIRWSLLDGQISGEGRSTNLSVNGLDIVMDSDFEPTVGIVLFIQSASGDAGRLQAKQAKVMWIRKTSDDGIEKFHCGLEYVKKES